MADATYQPKIYRKQGGAELVVASSGNITVEGGGIVTVNTSGVCNFDSGALLSIDDGGQITVPVVAETTTANLSNFGHSIVTATTAAGANTYTMDVPDRAGLTKTLRCITATTSDRVLVECQVSIGSSAAGNILAFETAGSGATLVSESTTFWAITGIYGGVGTTS